MNYQKSFGRVKQVVDVYRHRQFAVNLNSSESKTCVDGRSYQTSDPVRVLFSPNKCQVKNLAAFLWMLKKLFLRAFLSNK